MSKIPEAYIFENKHDQDLIKLPGSINEQVFNIMHLDHCNIYILDISATIYVDDCKNCQFFIAPVKDSFFLRDSTNCICSVACKQLRVKNCTDVTFFLYSVADPHIESSFDMKFAPYNFAYPGQDNDFRKVGFNTTDNRWCKVYDHSSGLGNGHFSLLPPSQFKNEEKRIEGYGRPVNPVPIPKQYGGDKIEDIVPGSKQANEANLPINSNVNRPERPPPLPVLNLQNIPQQPNDKPSEPVASKGNIEIFYDPTHGFVVGDDLKIPSQFNKKEFSDQIMRYNDTGKQFYENWAEHVFAIFLAVIAFLVIILIMSLMKMSSEWKLEATGVFLFLTIASLLFVVVLQIVRIRRMQKEWTSAVQEIANQQNSQYFERYSSKINAGYTNLTIIIGE